MENLQKAIEQKSLTYGKENKFIQDVIHKKTNKTEVLSLDLEEVESLINQSNNTFHDRLSLLAHQLNHLSTDALTQDILGFLKEALVSDPTLFENEKKLQNSLNLLRPETYCKRF